MLLIGGCGYVPQATMVYDQDCHIEARHMTMQPVQLGALGAVAAASAVYWFEKQGRCLAQAGA